MERESKVPSVEILTRLGVYRYPVTGSIYYPMIDLGRHPITNEPIRYNRMDECVEYQREDGKWDTLLSTKEIICVQIINPEEV